VPIRKRNVVVKMKGMAYFFSFDKRPGAINLQISQKITGELIIHAATNDIFMCIQNASAGARNTRFRSGFCTGIKEKYGVFREKARVWRIGEINNSKMFSE